MSSAAVCPGNSAYTAESSTCAGVTLFLNMVLALIEEKNQRNLLEKTQSRDEVHISYDFIVVGAGTAGCVVANRLSENSDTKVLLLEAGREEPDGSSVPSWIFRYVGSDVDWGYQGEPQAGSCNNTGCTAPRGKTMGGTSAINGMMYMRGNLKDYDLWEQAGNPGWGSDEALRLFKKSENNRDLEFAANTTYHGTRGFLDVQRQLSIEPGTQALAKGFPELGLEETDPNGKEQLGWYVNQATTREGERASANRAFIEPIRNMRPNLHIETRAHVTKVLINPWSKVTYGVEYMNVHGMTRRIIARKEVIISGGSINTPQILMLSGIGPKKHLKNKGIRVIQDLPGVGRDLQDHLTTRGVVLKLPQNLIIQDGLEQRVKHTTQYYKENHSGPYASAGPIQIGAFVQTEYVEENDTRPDIQLLFAGHEEFTTYFHSIRCQPLVLHPRSKGWIELRSSNPFDTPRIFQNVMSDPMDLKVLIAGIRQCEKLAKASAITKAGIKLDETNVPECKTLKFGSDEYWECVARTNTEIMYHPTSTCRMGSDPDACVDSRLRVHGIGRLRVIDASIMPSIISGNTNAPTFMIAEKGSELIKEDWGLEL